MIRLLFIVSFILLSVLGYSAAEARDKSSEKDNRAVFIDKPLEAVQEEAKAETKPVLAFFYVEGSEASKKIMQQTFSNKWVGIYLKKRYKPVKLKAFTIYSDPFIRRYEIESFPALAVINSKGELQKIIKGYIGPRELLKVLKDFEEAPYNLYRYQSASGSGSPADTLSSAEAFQDRSDPLLSIKLQEEAKVEGIYEFSIKEHRVLEKTLAVQVGVFSDYHNLVKNVLELDKNWHSNILVTSYEVNGESLYRLLLGPFYTSEHALSYRRNLREQKGLKGVIINLEDFTPLTEEEIEEFSVERYKK